jgi:phosphoribosylglycinamide formyltransferase 2
MARRCALVELEKPHLIVPEIEAIATDMLVEIEAAGLAEVIPTARAAKLTMNREGIRRLAAEELGLPTSPYRFADTLAELQAAIDGGHWLPVHRQAGDVLVRQGPVAAARPGRCAEGLGLRASGGRVNPGASSSKGFIDFDYEITLLTVRARDAAASCRPISANRSATFRCPATTSNPGSRRR